MRAVLLAVLVLCGTARANDGHPPFNASSIVFQRGHDDHLVAGTTFGLIESSDGGATWDWMCSEGVGYGGVYDPVYVFTESGAVFATTFHGLRVDRTGCGFELQPTAGTCQTAPDGGLAQCTTALTLAQAAGGTLLFGASDPTDSQIYASGDDGASWAPIANPGQPGDDWVSIAIAPASDQIVYLTGVRVSATTRVPLLFESGNGGQSFTPLGVDPTTLTTSSSATISIAAIDRSDPATFYLEIASEDGANKNGLWKTTDGGNSFVEILAQTDKLAFIVRANGDLVAATPTLGTQVSHDKGATWQPVAGAPHINCLSETSAGELWACTADIATAQVASDGAGIMKTVDLQAWTKVLRFEDAVAPRICAAATVQAQVCDAAVWCSIKDQFGIASQAIACPGDTPADAGVAPTPSAGGCCDSGRAPVGLALVPPVAMLLLRRRRR